uniref:Methyltransferase type 11 n=1 Tax=Solibacter usitatus (strain Ellin6076) TaxID=234267 RepID=Q024W5_SOLUE
MKPLLYILTAAAVLYLLNQVRKPTRWTGRFFVWMMNLSHSALTDWGLTHITIGRNFTILDVGCGGGRTIGKLSAQAIEGMVHGVDYANGSVAASRAAMKSGRVAITQASVSQLPFPDNTFDLVTAVETQYYWPDLVRDMQEILRVLKPGGTLLVIAESYAKGKHGTKFLNFARLSVEEQRERFSTSGYQRIQIFEERKQGWLCATGIKAGGGRSLPR